MSTIPVICDRCRSTGIAGQSDFSHLGDLLDFAPVPRKTKRADGWTPEKQRAFIAALSATGSKRQAASAIGMAPFGVDQMLRSDGNDSFKAAYDRAMAIAQQNGTMKIAQGVADAAARNAIVVSARSTTALTPPSRLRDFDPEPEPEFSEDQKWDLFERIGTRFMKKVIAEREARLAGQIVTADFYLRQITMIEITMDLVASKLGYDPHEVMRGLRRHGHKLLDIVETPFSEWLDMARRKYWEEQGDPPRPVHPDPRFTVKHSEGPWGDRGAGGWSTAVEDHSYGALSPPARGHSQEEWAKMNNDEQRLAREAQNAEDAAEQAEWEAKARRDYEDRCARSASS